MTKRFLTTLIVAAIASAGLASAASAAEITFTGNYAFMNGTGNGPIQGVLSLQDDGGQGNNFEWGYSGWSAPGGIGGTLLGGAGTFAESWSSSSSQVHKDTTPSGYFAQSVGTLALAGINQSNLAVVFQVNVAGKNDTMTVKTFDVVFIKADGSLAHTATYTPTYVAGGLAGTTIAGLGNDTDNGVLPGVGQGSSGWLYNIDLSSWNAAAFFADSNNRIGMNVSEKVGVAYNFQPVNDGSDNFFFTYASAPPPVPIPAALWTGMTALAGLGLAGKLRKKLHRD